VNEMVYNPKLTGERMNEVNDASPASETSDVERVVIRLPIFVGAVNDWDFSQGETILDALHDARAFVITKTIDGRFDIAEACDNNYGAVLTKEQMLILAAEIVAMAEGV